MEDTKRDHEAFNVRRQSEENVVLRKMYRGLLSKMHEWNADEQSELRYTGCHLLPVRRLITPVIAL
jgi:hypothetical protein